MKCSQRQASLAGKYDGSQLSRFQPIRKCKQLGRGFSHRGSARRTILDFRSLSYMLLFPTHYTTSARGPAARCNRSHPSRLIAPFSCSVNNFVTSWS